MKIAIASDHAGFKYKEQFKQYLVNKGYEVIDCGTDSNKSVDYPNIAYILGHKVLENNCMGIGICGSGIGISMALNKVQGIRAVNANNKKLATLSRKHNNANVICFGQRLMKFKQCTKLFELFIKEEFEGNRHQRRVDLLDKGDNYER